MFFSSGKKSSFFFAVFSFSIFITTIFYAYSSGITGLTLKDGDNGCFCHGSNASSEVNVVIDGPDELAAGETAAFSVSITGGPLAAAGTNIASGKGSLAPADTSLKLEDNQLAHNIVPKISTDNMVIFTFNYTAPDNSGIDTLFAVGNSVDNQGNSSGDRWNFAENKLININLPTEVDDEIINPKILSLEQNYPNPFNPETVIEFNIPESGNVKLILYNTAGEKIAQLIDEFKEPGHYRYKFNAGNPHAGRQDLSSGVYFYRLTVSSTFDNALYSETKKMVLLR